LFEVSARHAIDLLMTVPLMDFKAVAALLTILVSRLLLA
jgi:hypothetical protein